MAWYPGKYLGGMRGDQRVATAPTIEQQRQAFREEWKTNGATDAQIDKALLLADDWARSLARFTAQGNLALEQQIYTNIYPKALNTTAANWLRSIRMEKL